MSKIIYGADEKIPGESAYDRCSYKGCKNGKYRLGGRKLFLFPSHTEPDRREKWLQNCGNEELRKKANSSIRRSGVCSDHFDPSCFTDEKKYSLKRNSIPRPNYPPNFTNFNVNVDETCNNVDDISHHVSTRVPKLFVDDDDLSDEDNDIYTSYEDLSEMQKTENDMSDNTIAMKYDKNNYESTKLTDSSELFLEDDHDELDTITNESSFNCESAEKQTIINTEQDYEKITTSMSTIELLRTMNETQNKDKKIEKLMKQNMLLRKELKTLKQNVRRWERRRQKKSTIKKPTLKQQKRMVLNIVNEMDISPVAKAIISLQLHTRKAPYTEEEKNLAKLFQQYSRNDIKRLKNVGCNVPSRSSIKRWLSNYNESILSTSEQESIDNRSNDTLIDIDMFGNDVVV